MIRTIKRLAVAVLVACLAASALIAARQTGSSVAPPPQDQRPPVFRGVANFVYVDVYPRQNGKLVEGLVANDFQIFEDGKPQKVETFELIRSEPNTPDADRRDPNTKADSDRQAADPHNRVFVIYLDPYHTTFAGAHYAKTPLLDFLGRTIGPTDLFGVMRPEVPVNQLVFGRRTETLEIELTRYFDWGKEGRAIMADTPIEQQLIRCGRTPDVGEMLVRLHREDLLATSLEDLMVHLRDLRDERKNVLLISEGWVPEPDHPGLLTESSGAPPRIGTDPTGRLRIGPQNGLTDDNWCNQQIGRLAGLNLEQRFRELLTLANRANVSFYPVDVGGLKTNLPDASMSGVPSAQQVFGMMNTGRARTDTLRTLAENTDGTAIVDTNGLEDGFRRIADDLSAYYLLGYSSTNTNLDGRFHRIEVKVTRPKVSVSARRGYLAGTATAAASAAASAIAVVPGIVEALARPARLRDDTEMLAYGVASGAAVNIVVEIASARLSQWANGADVRISLSGAKGTVTMTGAIEAGTRAAIVSVPIAEAGAGPWRGSVVVTRGNNQGEDRIEVRVADGPLLGDPVAFRGTASARIALRPVADFQFRRTERVHVEWPVLVPLDQRTARLLDRRGQPLPFETAVTDRDANGVSMLAADLSLGSLGEGDYIIEVSVGSGAEKQRALLAFRVIR